MTTYPRGDLVLLTAFDGKPVDPQPDVLDDREPPDGHYGLPVMCEGQVKGWYPPVADASDRSAERAAIMAKLAELDRLTMHRAMEAWAKVNGDAFVKEKIAEKETLRAELAQIDGQA